MRTLLLPLILLGGSMGCVHLQPVGPMADVMGTKPAPTKPSPGVTVTPPTDAAMKPIASAPPPAPPALMVTPGEVTEANYKDAARRLMGELEADRRAMDSMPRYAEVSVVKGSR